MSRPQSNPSRQPLFRPNAGGYDISPAGALLLAAATVYGDPSETTPQGLERAHTLIDEILSAAHAGGYKQSDILRTLLTRNQPSARVAEMAQDAVSAAGSAAIREVFQRLGFGKGGAS